MGADDYLAKPFSSRELLARARAIMRRTQHTPPQAQNRRYSFDAFVIDIDARGLSVGENSAVDPDEWRIRTAGLFRPATAPGADAGPDSRLDARSIRGSVRPHRRHADLALAQEAGRCEPRLQPDQHRPQRRLSVHRSCETADMILRMTFAARIGLIVVVELGMAWISTIALYYIARAHTAESNTLPVPGHIAALVELIERTPSEERKLVLRVASSETFAARIDAGANTGTTAQRILPRLNQRAIDSSAGARRPPGQRQRSPPWAASGWSARRPRCRARSCA